MRRDILIVRFKRRTNGVSQIKAEENVIAIIVTNTCCFAYLYLAILQELLGTSVQALEKDVEENVQHLLPCEFACKMRKH